MTSFRSALSLAVRASMIGLCLVLAPLGCGPENRAAPTVPLNAGVTNVNSGVLGGTGKPAVVMVAPFTDERPRKEQIGENVQARDTVLPVYSSGLEPAEYVRQALIQSLRNGGYEVTDNPVAAGRVVSGKVTQFWVVEGQTFKANVNVAFEVKDAAGTSLWSGAAASERATWGHTLSIANYQKVISSATVDVINHLFNDAGFRPTLRVP